GPRDGSRRRGLRQPRPLDTVAARGPAGPSGLGPCPRDVRAPYRAGPRSRQRPRAARSPSAAVGGGVARPCDHATVGPCRLPGTAGGGGSVVELLRASLGLAGTLEPDGAARPGRGRAIVRAPGSGGGERRAGTPDRARLIAQDRAGCGDTACAVGWGPRERS